MSFKRYLSYGTTTYLLSGTPENGHAIICGSERQVLEELPKASPTIFNNRPRLDLLRALCSSDNQEVRQQAYPLISEVCRDGEDLFYFCSNLERGWSRGFRNGVSRFYTTKPLADLERDFARHHWAPPKAGLLRHRDVLRLIHAKANSPELNDLFRWEVEKLDAPTPLIEAAEKAYTGDLIIQGFTDHLLTAVQEFRLPWTLIPKDQLPRILPRILPLLSVAEGIWCLEQGYLRRPSEELVAWLEARGTPWELAWTGLLPQGSLAGKGTWSVGKGCPTKLSRALTAMFGPPLAETAATVVYNSEERDFLSLVNSQFNVGPSVLALLQQGDSNEVAKT